MSIFLHSAFDPRRPNPDTQTAWVATHKTEGRPDVTLSVAVVGAGVGIIRLSNYQFAKPYEIGEGLFLISLFCMCVVTILSFIGKMGKYIQYPTIDMLDSFRRDRERRIRMKYKLYVISVVIFLLGFLLFPATLVLM